MGSDQPTDPLHADQHPAHVLVVSGDETVRTNLAALVRQVGYRGAAAPDLAAARQLLAASWVRYDVVVFDATDGELPPDAVVIEFTSRHDVGVVLVTAPDDIRSMTPNTDYPGSVGFVTVPVSAAKMLRSIAAVLRPLQARRRSLWYAELVKIQQRQRSRNEPVIDITGHPAGSAAREL